VLPGQCWGTIVKARALIDGACFGPAALKVLGRAFDEAWASIAGNFCDGQVEGARLRLANAILSIANEDSRDIAALKNAAIEAMRRQH
jgi:hypothetical protein